MATESTPLVAHSAAPPALIRDFNQELDQESDETLYSLLVKRPFIAALAFTLFCLVVIVAQSFSSALNYDWQQLVSYNLKSIELGALDRATLEATATVELDLAVSGALRHAFDWLDHVKVEFEPFSVYFLDEYLMAVHPTTQLELSLKGASLVTVDSTCRDIGHPDTIQALVDRFLGNESVPLKAVGAVTVSAFGIPYRVPISQLVEIGSAAGEENLGNIQQVHMEYDGNGLQFSLQSLLGALELPVQMTLPATEWTVQLADCGGNRHDVCVGTARALALDLRDPNNVTVDAAMTHLPTALTAICDTNKSSIDTIISQYLNGESNHVYVRGHAPQDTFLGRALNSLDLDLRISGKPLAEKLVDSVQIHNVRITPEGEFSGELTVVIHLPQLFDIDSSVVMGAQNIRGNFILSHNDIPFGRVPLKEWTQTVTTHLLGQYLVQVYFNHVPFTVLDARELAAVSRELMFAGSVPVNYLAAVDVDVISPIAQFFVTDLAIDGDTVLERA